MMALVPFCLFLITVFGNFLDDNPDLIQFFIRKLVGFFPAVTRSITDEIVDLISYQGIGKFSLVLYGVLSFQVFASLENALNAVFKVRQKRKFFFSILISLAVVTLIMALLITSFAAASIIPFLKSLSTTIPAISIGKSTEFLIRFAVSFLLVLFTVTMMYVMLPKKKIRFVNSLKGAIFTTVLFEVAKHAFTWYVGMAVHLGKIYGSLSAFIVFLLWVFYSSSIFLIGAEIVNNLGNANKR